MMPPRLVAVERWFLRSCVFLLPLAYFWNTYDRYVLPKLVLARILLIGLLLLFVARATMIRRLSFRRTPLDLPLLAFIVSASLSTLVAYNRNVAVFGSYARYDGLLSILTYAALFWLTVQAITGPEDARTLLRVMLVSGYLVAAVAIVQSIVDSTTQGTLIAAAGSLGQKNVLGILLAMLIPIAIRELVEARSWSIRILCLNVLVVIASALVLSLSRSAWLGAAVAIVLLIVCNRRPSSRTVLAAVAIPALVGSAVALASLNLHAWGGTPARPYVWRDSLTLIANRPIFGFGPDNFGLVYPSVQSINLGPQQFDKAHAESLQIAVTQGLVGFAAYVFLLVALIRAWWRGKRTAWAAATFAGLIAYQISLQLNFSTVPASLSFWVFAAAALESWGAVTTGPNIRLARRRWTFAASGVAVAALAVAALVGALLPYLADARLSSAVKADIEGSRGAAQHAAAEARALAPQESVYAVEVANIAFEGGNWVKARDAYLDAALLGTYNPLVYRNLALADRNLGLRAEAAAAARKAFEMDRYDPANRALMAEFEVPGP